MRLLAQTSAARGAGRHPPGRWRVACRIRPPCAWPWRGGPSKHGRPLVGRRRAAGASPQARDTTVQPHALARCDPAQGKPRCLFRHLICRRLRKRPPCVPAPSALHLHGLLTHWSEVPTQQWLAPMLDWEEQQRARRSLERRQSAAHIEHFKPLCDSELDLAEALRPRRCRCADHNRLPQGGRQRLVFVRAERRRQVDVCSERGPSGGDRRPHRAVHQRRPAAR